MLPSRNSVLAHPPLQSLEDLRPLPRRGLSSHRLSNKRRRRWTLVHLWVHPSEEDGQEAGGTGGSADIERRASVGVGRLFLAVLEERSLARIRAEDLIAYRFLRSLRGNGTGADDLVFRQGLIETR